MDRFSRVKALFQDDFYKLQNIKVLVLGCGGVGGACIDALYRSGVVNLVVVDCDKFEITNQNRQIASENLDEYKTDVFSKLYKGIKGINQKIDENFINSFNFEEFDFIVDAIDDMKAKVYLANKILSLSKKPIFISSMGSAKKLDPSKILISSIWKTNTDALAKKFRYELRKSGFDGDFDVVYSSEEPKECQNNALGSCIVVTASFGLFLASYVINKTIEFS